MILFPEFVDYADCAFGLALRLYMDADITTELAADGVEKLTLHLPRRTWDALHDPRRYPRLPTPIARSQFAAYRRPPELLPIRQFYLMDDNWAERTIQLVQTKFRNSANAAMHVALFMWYNILLRLRTPDGRSYDTGYTVALNDLAAQLGHTENYVNKVVVAMLDAELIHRKWVGNNLMGRGSCYLPGSPGHVDQLLAENPI